MLVHKFSNGGPELVHKFSNGGPVLVHKFSNVLMTSVMIYHED